jgi:hypothetical protein
VGRTASTCAERHTVVSGTMSFSTSYDTGLSAGMIVSGPMAPTSSVCQSGSALR